MLEGCHPLNSPRLRLHSAVVVSILRIVGVWRYCMDKVSAFVSVPGARDVARPRLHGSCDARHDDAADASSVGRRRRGGKRIAQNSDRRPPSWGAVRKLRQYFHGRRAGDIAAPGSRRVPCPRTNEERGTDSNDLWAVPHAPRRLPIADRFVFDFPKRSHEERQCGSHLQCAVHPGPWGAAPGFMAFLRAGRALRNLRGRTGKRLLLRTS